MSFLPDLDREWRGETPEDFWLEMYHHASLSHREMIHEVMQRCGLTTREATQKIFKCDEACALADRIPDKWNTPVFSSLTAQQVTEIVDAHTMEKLVAASHADPDTFDDAIRLHDFLRGPRDTR